MNRWDCGASKCQSSCVGIGGAVGLRAIGWYFTKGINGSGPLLYCPSHYPDKCIKTCKQFDCKLCKRVARYQQRLMKAQP